MPGWVLAALIGAVPLYFGFNSGRRAPGLSLGINIGVMLSLVVLGLVVATSATTPALVLPALGLSYVSGVGLVGTLAGSLARLFPASVDKGSGR